MADNEKRISLRLDLSNGIIELDAPTEIFDHAMVKIQELAQALSIQKPRVRPMETAAETLPAAPPIDQTAATESIAHSGTQRRSKSTKASSGRSGRIGSFEEIRGLLSEEQEIELRDFVAAKAPAEQTDQALVAIVKGEQLLDRKGFNYNEIYTLMWLAGIKDLPKALDVVLLRLIQEQMITKEATGFVAKFVGRNRVDRDLPRTTKEG
jgi:hypothetical protein